MDAVRFLTIQRQIFGVCPRSGELFRLSDCTIFQKKKPLQDWMDNLDAQAERLDLANERLDEKEEALREKAREKGRKQAMKAVRRLDSIFTPRRLNPDDAKVIFHPIDYIVFSGMKQANEIQRIVLLDKEASDDDHRRVQHSIEKVIETENYEWQTLRVQEDGKIVQD